MRNSAADLNLLLLRMLMLASRVALILWRWTGFFSFLHIQTWESIDAHRKTRGSWQSPTFRSRRTTWCGRRFGMCLDSLESRNWPAPSLYGHCRRQWFRFPIWFWSHRVHRSDLMLGILSLYSLVGQGSRLWVICHRNDKRFEGRPGVTANVQHLSQSASGDLISALQGRSTVLSFAIWWVTLYSSRTLYHWPDDIVLIFSRPSCLTILM